MAVIRSCRSSCFGPRRQAPSARRSSASPERCTTNGQGRPRLHSRRAPNASSDTLETLASPHEAVAPVARPRRTELVRSARQGSASEALANGRNESGSARLRDDRATAAHGKQNCRRCGCPTQSSRVRTQTTTRPGMRRCGARKVRTQLVFFIKTGAFTFRSRLAIVPFLHQGLVDDHHWRTEQQFVDAVTIGLMSPGPVVIMATFAGYLICGVTGAVVATIAAFLPVYFFVVVPGGADPPLRAPPPAEGLCQGRHRRCGGRDRRRRHRHRRPGHRQRLVGRHRPRRPRAPSCELARLEGAGKFGPRWRLRWPTSAAVARSAGSGTLTLG